MEFTGNIDESVISDIVTDQLQNHDYVEEHEVERIIENHSTYFVCEDDLDRKLDAIDERIAQAVVTESDFDGLARRIRVLEGILASFNALWAAILCGSKPEQSDAPEA